jgi:hypothetical protein
MLAGACAKPDRLRHTFVSPTERLPPDPRATLPYKARVSQHSTGLFAVVRAAREAKWYRLTSQVTASVPRCRGPQPLQRPTTRAIRPSGEDSERLVSRAIRLPSALVVDRPTATCIYLTLGPVRPQPAQVPDCMSRSVSRLSGVA